MNTPPRTKVQRHPVHGVLLLDKPLEMSSNQALQKAKWLLRAEKAGHTGTLDPLATGVLPLCFGAGTKFSQLHLDADKCYEATLLLGQTTATGDAEGEILQTRPVPEITPELLAVIQAQFTGPQQQTPPMHSALKKGGKALYEYARAGQTVEREARNITVYALKLALDQQTRARAAIKMIVTCSKGTYIRTLGEDIAEAIGCGGHLIALRRTASGSFDQAQCVTLAALEAMDEASRHATLLPVDALLAGFTAVTLDDENAGRFLSGLRRRGAWPDATNLAVYSQSDSALLGTAHTQGGELICDRLLSPLEVGAIRFRPPDLALANS